MKGFNTRKKEQGTKEKLTFDKNWLKKNLVKKKKESKEEIEQEQEVSEEELLLGETPLFEDDLSEEVIELEENTSDMEPLRHEEDSSKDIAYEEQPLKKLSIEDRMTEIKKQFGSKSLLNGKLTADSKIANLTKNMTISQKLSVGFGLVLFFLVASVAVGLFGVNSIHTQIEKYGTYTVPNSGHIRNMQTNLLSSIIALQDAIYAEDPAVKSKAIIRSQESIQEFNRAFTYFKDNQEEATDVANIEISLAGVMKYQDEIIEYLEADTDSNRAQAKKLFSTEYYPRSETTRQFVRDLVRIIETRAVSQREDAKKVTASAWILLLTCVIISIGLTIGVVFVIRKSIINPTKQIMDAFGEIAQGKLNYKIPYEGKDEIGEMAKLIEASNQIQSSILEDIISKISEISKGNLCVQMDMDYPGDYASIKQSMEETVINLNEIMKAIYVTADQVNIGAEQVSGGAEALASGSTEQAATIEELESSVSEVANQAVRNQETIKETAHVVQKVVEEINTGNTHMGQLKDAMSDIESISGQIAGITKTIEDIAFQTNILSLNAAIEAARAGDAGRGFAVVADEVRKLAAQSADAAKQTAELIESTVETIAKGTEITGETVQVLRNVGIRVEGMMDGIVKIEESSGEQTLAIDQIKQGLEQVASVIQNNAATAEENSATSEEMTAQVVVLREKVGMFKLND